MEPDRTELKYRLLAVDVDGTLIHGGDPSEQDIRALHAAAEAGITVCLCTGRAWPEVRPIWAKLQLPPPYGPVVCVGGAIVTEPDTGRTLCSRAFDRDTAADLAGAMREMGYPVMALVDQWREGFDYYIVGDYAGHPCYERFFDARGGRLRFVDSLADLDGPRPLRISILDDADEAAGIVAELRRRFDGRIEIQAIHLSRSRVHIAEAFAAGAHKLNAMIYVAQGLRLGRGSLAAIGDDDNDIVLLRGAGLSATPSDATDELRAAADVVVSPRGPGAVAEFVKMLLGG